LSSCLPYLSEFFRNLFRVSCHLSSQRGRAGLLIFFLSSRFHVEHIRESAHFVTNRRFVPLWRFIGFFDCLGSFSCFFCFFFCLDLASTKVAVAFLRGIDVASANADDLLRKFDERNMVLLREFCNELDRISCARLETAREALNTSLDRLERQSECWRREIAQVRTAVTVTVCAVCDFRIDHDLQTVTCNCKHTVELTGNDIVESREQLTRTAVLGASLHAGLLIFGMLLAATWLAFLQGSDHAATVFAKCRDVFTCGCTSPLCSLFLGHPDLSQSQVLKWRLNQELRWTYINAQQAYIEVELASTRGELRNVNARLNELNARVG